MSPDSTIKRLADLLGNDSTVARVCGPWSPGNPFAPRGGGEGLLAFELRRASVQTLSRMVDRGTLVCSKFGKLLEGFDFHKIFYLLTLASSCDLAKTLGSDGWLGLWFSLGPLHGPRDCDSCLLPSVP